MKLIFIHGAGGCKESRQYQTQYFKDSEAIDLPGHPDGDLLTTIDEYAEWLHDYVIERGYTDLVIAGHSLSGGIALLYGLTYPENLKGLIAVGSGGRLRVHPMFLEALEKAVADPAGAQDTPQQTTHLIDPELAAIIERRRAENGPSAALNDLRACDRFDIMDRLGEIDVPMLAICGTEDNMTPPKYTSYLANNVKNARAVIVEGGTHYVFAEKPREVNTAIESFLHEIA